MSVRRRAVAHAAECRGRLRRAPRLLPTARSVRACPARRSWPSWPITRNAQRATPRIRAQANVGEGRGSRRATTTSSYPPPVGRGHRRSCRDRRDGFGRRGAGSARSRLDGQVPAAERSALRSERSRARPAQGEGRVGASSVIATCLRSSGSSTVAPSGLDEHVARDERRGASLLGDHERRHGRLRRLTQPRGRRSSKADARGPRTAFVKDRREAHGVGVEIRGVLVASLLAPRDAHLQRIVGRRAANDHDARHVGQRGPREALREQLAHGRRRRSLTRAGQKRRLRHRGELAEAPVVLCDPPFCARHAPAIAWRRRGDRRPREPARGAGPPPDPPGSSGRDARRPRPRRRRAPRPSGDRPRTPAPTDRLERARAAHRTRAGPPRRGPRAGAPTRRPRAAPRRRRGRHACA